MPRYTLAFLLLFFLKPAFADGQQSRAEYIQRFHEVAVEEMKLYGIPASITLAQGLLESNNGNSMLATKANNHFGIKCHSDWEGKRIYKDDDAKNECFRVYKSAWESFRDHSKFLQSKRYKFLYEYKSTDYKSWAKGLKKAGYATNPKYPDLLIRIIEENKLFEYDDPKFKGARKEEIVEAKKDKPAEVKKITRRVPSNELVLRERYSTNRVRYILSPHDVHASRLARQLRMGLWQIRKYNDVASDHLFKKGDVIYLQPKRNKGSLDTYKVRAGDTAWSISQDEAVKLKRIQKLNGLSEDEVLEEGRVLRMRN